MRRNRPRPRARGLSEDFGRAQRVDSADSWRSVRKGPGKRPIDSRCGDDMSNAPRRECRIMRGNVRRLITTNEGRDTAANAEAATGSGVVFGRRRCVVAAVCIHRHVGRPVGVRRSGYGRVDRARVNARRFEKRGVEPQGPKADQGSKPKRASHGL